MGNRLIIGSLNRLHTALWGLGPYSLAPSGPGGGMRDIIAGMTANFNKLPIAGRCRWVVVKIQYSIGECPRVHRLASSPSCTDSKLIARVDSDAVCLHVVEGGRPANRPVVGFPDVSCKPLVQSWYDENESMLHRRPPILLLRTQSEGDGAEQVSTVEMSRAAITVKRRRSEFRCYRTYPRIAWDWMNP